MKLASKAPVHNEKIKITGFGRINSYKQRLSYKLKTYNSYLVDYDHCNEISLLPIDKTDFCDKLVPDVGTCMVSII